MTDPANSFGLSETFHSRRYFRKFETVTGHLARVAGVMEADGKLSRAEVTVLAHYVQRLRFTFKALGLKYLLAGRDTGRFFGSLAIDRTESGFPTAAEIFTLGNDALQASAHLRGAASVEQLKRDMVAMIVGERKVPTKLQFALSQRLYYEELSKGHLFWARNDPDAQWVRDLHETRREFLLHWAVWDSKLNLPVIYLMQCEDSGRTTLPRDQRRWPEVQAHLTAQALAELKLVTIAKGFDEDFDDLHPKRLRRFYLGPLYSDAFTAQTGALGEVLAQAKEPRGQDWALVWTEEDLQSERVIEERAGWFSTVEREVFRLDPFSARAADTGATHVTRSVILPQRPFQALSERNPVGFEAVEKYVVGASNRILRY